MPDASQIGEPLSRYLGAAVNGLRVLASGWETTVFELALGARSPQSPEIPLDRPLVLRFYEGSQADDKGSRESLTIRRLAEARYPVPRPYLFEPDHGPLGAPFLIMERVAGGPLFAIDSFPNAFKTFSLGFFAFVRAQAQLHRLAAALRLDDLPCAYAAPSENPSASLLDRILAIIADRIDRGPLPGLRGALEHLRADAARFRQAPAAIVHMDYHPQNVIVKGIRVTGVIDWVSADRGDRHLCAATTAAILSSTAMERPHWMGENFAGNSLRTIFASMYLPLYHAMAPVQWPRFRFCQAVAALLRLSTFGMMRVRGPEAAGFRPQAIENVTPPVVRLLSRYLARRTGVLVSIDPARG
jgi:aminoglycoside phosphotransferase (APT) family kinase protein